MKIVKAEVESIYLRVVGRRPGYLTTGGHRHRRDQIGAGVAIPPRRKAEMLRPSLDPTGPTPFPRRIDRD
jgi:hypothetical protein